MFKKMMKVFCMAAFALTLCSGYNNLSTTIPEDETVAPCNDRSKGDIENDSSNTAFLPYTHEKIFVTFLS